MLAKLSVSDDFTPQLSKSEFFKQMNTLLEEGVEYVGIINKNGRIEEAIYKSEMNMTKEKKEMFSMIHQLHNSMQSDFDEEFGTVNYTITERENSRFVSIPIPKGILLVKLNKSMDPFLFINKTAGMNFAKLLDTSNGVIINEYL